MLNKVLWIICGFLITANFTLLIFKDDFVYRYNPKEVKSATIEPQDKTSTNSENHPIKNSDAQDPKILAESVFLADGETLYPLYGKNEKERVPVASLTKIITALVVLENYPEKLQNIIEITPRETGITGDSIKLRAYEEISVENLLYGLLMMSGNDAAAALSDNFGGKDAFVAAMNQKIKQIGAKDTQFLDPAGLDDDGYSTAYDVVLISSYALKNPKFAEIVKTPSKTITSTNGRVVHELKNSNRMIQQDEKKYFYPNAIGLKTGFTTPAGHVLASAAEKDGHRIVGVVLHTNKNTLTASAEESKKLLEWGFASWAWSK